MSTLNLPFVRFTRQVSNGMARTKYSYQAMQQDLLAALQKSLWKKATCSSNAVTTVVNKVTQTDAEKDESGTITKEPTYTTFLDERFDAYKQGGDANSSTASFCGYAGMVAYRFELPTGYNSNITEVKVPLQSSRYLRSGLRVCVVLSNSSTPSTNWTEIRGDGSNAIVSAHSSTDCPEGVSSWGVLNQTVPILLDTRPQEQTITFKSSDFPALGTFIRYSYLWVYVSIEDYCDYWTWYSLSEPRYYSIEGSATVIGSACTVSFAGDVSLPTTLWRHTLEAVPRGFYMPYARVTVAGRYDQHQAANIEAFGNLFNLSSFEAGMLLDYTGSNTNSTGGISVPTNATGDSYTARLLQYPKFPRKDFFTRFYDCPQETSLVDINAHYSDLGVFALNPAKMELELTTGTSKQWRNHGGSTDDTIWYTLKHTNGGPTGGIWYQDMQDESQSHMFENVVDYAMLRLKSTARIVPHGKTEYKRMSVLGTWTGTTASGSTDPVVEARINIWKCSTHDAMGYWRVQAIGALLSHQELYTVSEKNLTVNVTGTGTWSAIISVSPTAEYVGSMPIPNGSPLEFDLDGSVAPGDMLIFVPQITYVPTSQNVFENTVTFNYILVA